MSGNLLSANLGSRGVGVITGANGIKPGVGSETNFPQNSFCAFLHTFFSGGAATTFGTGVHEAHSSIAELLNSEWLLPLFGNPTIRISDSWLLRPSLTAGLLLSKVSKKNGIAAVQTATAMPLCGPYGDMAARSSEQRLN